MSKAQHMTNAEVADRIGCHHSMASRVRSGARVPGLSLLSRICVAFAIPIDKAVAAAEKGGDHFARLMRKYVP